MKYVVQVDVKIVAFEENADLRLPKGAEQSQPQVRDKGERSFLGDGRSFSTTASEVLDRVTSYLRAEGEIIRRDPA